MMGKQLLPAGGGGGTDKKTDGSSTNKGYKISTILNLLAKSLARVNVILIMMIVYVNIKIIVVIIVYFTKHL